LAASTSRSKADAYRVTRAMELPPRSKPSVVCAISQPCPSRPIRSDFSTRALVMKTSLNSALPVICFSGRTSTPGWRMFSRKHEMPLCLATPGSVRARRMPQSEMCPPLVQIFWPLTTKWSPLSSARVRRLARSEPEFGSE
jgi:hypothetical protein